MKLKVLKETVLFCFIIITLQNKAQQVINSAGGDHQLGTSGVYISDNVGEPFVQTFGPAANMMITQGYLQPIIIQKTIPDIKPSYTLSAFVNSLLCRDKNADAFIKLEVLSSALNFTPTFIWASSAYCPKGNCSMIDSLAPGKYAVQVLLQSIDKKGNVRADTTINASYDIVNSSVDCNITIYHGVTPNNDGVNETWIIEDIEKYPNNEVTIYNRWGYEIFKTKNYDNKNNVWPTKDQLVKLASSTYFYIIDLGNGTSPRKGWVELIKD